MSQIFTAVAAVLIIVALSVLIVILFKRFSKRKLAKFVYVIISVVLSLVLLVGASAIYLNIYYGAQTAASEALKDTTEVKVNKTDNGYFFDGKGESTALIFYQGAKVDCVAYAPLMQKIAGKGIDCFLVNMPFRLAIFGKNAADGIIDKYNYSNWIMAGHSMGGVMASGYAQEHTDKINGVLLLASYPNVELNDNIKTLSIYGDLDGILNKSAYDSAKEKMPESTKEIVIKGGNHSGFGNYGEQSGDKTAEITNDEQQSQTAAAAAEFFKAA